MSTTNFTENDWRKLCGLEYALTQGYSQDVEKDTRELMSLRASCQDDGFVDKKLKQVNKNKNNEKT